MKKSTIEMIRVFTTEKEANDYAAEKKGKVTITYDYDDLKKQMIKNFVVKVCY